MAQRGDTYQPQGYLNQGRPQQIQMRNYPDSSSHPNPKPQQHHSLEPAKQQQSSMAGYMLHWVAFLASLGIFIGIWALDTYAIKRQYSYYYQNSMTFATTIDTTTYTSAASMFSPNDHTDTVSIVMSIVYSWALWKLPLVIYALHLIAQQPSFIMRIVTWIIQIVLLVAADILLTVFAKSFYGQWTFFGIYLILTVIIAVVNNAGISRAKQALKNSFIPLLLIALLYCTYILFLPKLYSVYNQKITNSITRLFLIFYIYPAFDLILYILVLSLGSLVQDSVKGFHSMIHYFMIGYGAGMILLVGYTQVQFYYLIAYFIFRNVFVNHVMRKWERVVANPSALPGWGIAYYLAYALSFMPIVGLGGKLVISKSFRSYIFALTTTSLYSLPNPLYSSSTPPTTSLSTNFSFNGYIYWLSGLLIWLAFTFSQKYQRKSPKIIDFFYYLLGVYLFYLGIASALSVGPLTSSAHI